MLQLLFFALSIVCNDNQPQVDLPKLRNTYAHIRTVNLTCWPIIEAYKALEFKQKMIEESKLSNHQVNNHFYQTTVKARAFLDCSNCHIALNNLFALPNLSPNEKKVITNTTEFSNSRSTGFIDPNKVWWLGTLAHGEKILKTEIVTRMNQKFHPADNETAHISDEDTLRIAIKLDEEFKE